jgi:hypothetical protein
MSPQVAINSIHPVKNSSTFSKHIIINNTKSPGTVMANSSLYAASGDKRKSQTPLPQIKSR